MIIPGKVVVTANGVTLPPPAGFNTTTAVRIGNLSAGALVLTNVDPGNPSQEYLLPNQQNVYVSSNTAQNITMQSQNGDTPATIAADLYVEWSTEGDWRKDFQGVYPAQITASAQVLAEAIFAQGVPNVLKSEQVLPDVNGNYAIGGFSALFIGLVVGSRAHGGIPPVAAVPSPGAFTIMQNNAYQLSPGVPFNAPAYLKTFSVNTQSTGLSLIPFAAIPQLMLAIPVRASAMTVTFQPFTANNVATAVVVGSNAALDEDQVSNSNGALVMATTTTAAGFNVFSSFGLAGIDYYVSKGGTAQIVASATVAGQVYLQQLNSTGGSANLRAISLAAGVTAVVELTLPKGLLAFYFVPVSGTGSAQMDILMDL